ncbi:MULTISPECIES: FadR/GntR family transcriptional regulator [Micrococcaceae]|uniref:FadR/GntR family transcriptional regulator n=1 Tax=Micrococcaceae TaxID=1268 RepID=UPI001F1BB492|nr:MULTISPECIES: FadR/GntR family transcriptional regulator [Micrococcaceae]MCF3139640.1 FadR family transcriptional regulator [Paenarthrobacter sp. AR 02]MCR1162463.1 FadR family transcriptional regulator [Paenarthrobacter sp. UW852]
MTTSGVVPQARFSAQARLRALQSDIMELILERELEAGDPLPTESELSVALGVGRNTLRESLKVLQALGVIEIRHGFGMFVAPSNFDALADGLTFRGRLSLRHQGLEALQLVDVRQALESGLIGSSMDVMTPEQLASIEEAVKQMEDLAAAGENFVAADAEFHRRLFEPLNNELLINLMGVFWKVYRKIHVEIGPGNEDLMKTAAMHRNIYAAVAAGDKASASELLNRHFDGIRRRIGEAVGD